jgi:hypothetical protein
MLLKDQASIAAKSPYVGSATTFLDMASEGIRPCGSSIGCRPAFNKRSAMGIGAVNLLPSIGV